MPAPKNPNPGPAAAARRQLGDKKAIERLEAGGYWVISPDDLARLPVKLRQAIQLALGKG